MATWIRAAKVPIIRLHARRPFVFFLILLLNEPCPVSSLFDDAKSESERDIQREMGA